MKIVDVEWRDVKALFLAHASAYPLDRAPAILSLPLPEVGLRLYWYLAPRGHYHFFAPRFRLIPRWQELHDWHCSFFTLERVGEIKRLARKNGWAFRKLPVLAQLNIPNTIDFGSDFSEWELLASIEEFVLPDHPSYREQLLDYLGRWQASFQPFLYREMTPKPPAVMSVTSEVTRALLASPLTSDPGRVIETANDCCSKLRKILSEFDEQQFRAALFTDDVWPCTESHHLYKILSLSDEAKRAWHAVAELRVTLLEKFPFPWFYDSLLTELGALGARHALSASELMKTGQTPLVSMSCHPEFRDRVGQVALKIETRYPILADQAIGDFPNGLGLSS